MAKYIGRLINVGVGVESTRGTKVAAANWQRKTDFSFEERAEYVDDMASQGSIIDANDSHLVKKYAEGELGANITVNSLGYWLYALLGTVSATEDSTGAYLHAFSLQETNQSPSLTVAVQDPVLGGVSFPLAMIESMTISVDEGTIATFTVSLKGRPGEAATHTVSHAVDYTLLSRSSKLYTAANLAGLDAATAFCFKSFEITFTKNLMDDYCVGSTTPVDFINRNFSIAGSFSVLFEDGTYRDNHLDGTKSAVRFEIEDASTIIGASSNPRLTIDLASCAFTEFARTQGNDEVVTQTVTFKGLRSQADGEAVSMELVNTIDDHTA